MTGYIIMWLYNGYFPIWLKVPELWGRWSSQSASIIGGYHFSRVSAWPNFRKWKKILPAYWNIFCTSFRSSALWSASNFKLTLPLHGFSSLANFRDWSSGFAAFDIDLQAWQISGTDFQAWQISEKMIFRFGKFQRLIFLAWPAKFQTDFQVCGFWLSGILFDWVK